MSSINISENSTIDISIERNKLLDDPYQIQWNNFYQDSYYFMQDIERVWVILRSFEVLSILSSQGNSPCIFLKGKDTWSKGNEFKGHIFGRFPFIAKVTDCSNLPEIKKIEWIIQTRKKYLLVTIELFKVTEDNSTVAIKQMKTDSQQINDDEKAQIQIIEKKLFEKIDKILETEPISLLNYESAIINGKMEDIWNIITDFNKLTAIAPNNNYLPSINVRNMKIEEKKEVSVFYNDEIKIFDMTLKCWDERPGWNKWLIVCEISGGNPVKIPKHIVLFQLTKISNNECQLTLLTKFHEPISTKEFKKITDQKKYLLLSIKDYFQNFYTPNSSN